MRDWLPRIIILGLLGIVLGVPFVFKPADASHTAGNADGSARLVIITPHNEQIRSEIANAFNTYRKALGKEPIGFDWRTSGGTSDLRKMVIADFTAKAAVGYASQGIGIDLFFGGGDYEHNQLARGVPVEGQDDREPIVEPIVLPQGMLQQVYPKDNIGGEPLYHPKLYWCGVVLSSFGIVYNRDVLEMRHLTEPSTWSDLENPNYHGWLALADPAHSGSLAQTYNTILRRAGWNEGWAQLRRIFANARYFTSGASKVPVDVSSGEAAAGMCIDFYGRYQAGAVGGNRVGYIDPPYVTAVTADPITILRGAPQQELANEFVVWILQKDTQKLWQRRIGTANGPVTFELRRQPIRRDLYTSEEAKNWTDPLIKPFEIARDFPKGTPNYYSYVAPVAHSMAIDIHEELGQAWAAINSVSDSHLNKAKMIELFDAMPDPLVLKWDSQELAANWLTIMQSTDHPQRKQVVDSINAHYQALKQRWSDHDQQLKDRLDWTLFFRENYRQIVELAKAD
jgi:ABC-type Fe3+ transport system substrate-binding protein